MNWNNARLIFLREVRDQLRDRRTLFMIAILPLLLYPALAAGMMNMALLSAEQPRTILVLNADDLPQFCSDCSEDGESPVPALVRDESFRPELFKVPSQAEKLRVVTDRPRDDDDAELSPKLAALIADSAELQRLVERRSEAEQAGETSQELNVEISRRMADAKVQVLVVAPNGFARNLEAVNRRLAAGDRDIENLPQYPGLIVLRNSADEKSRMAYDRVREVLANWERAVLMDRLGRARLPEHVASPVSTRFLEVAEADQISASIWSKLFPALLVIMAVTGAFYPAVDLAAGEKERGTMETLLICPASRTEIVVGKFVTIMAFSISTALLNLLAMVLTGKHFLTRMDAGQGSELAGLSPPGLDSLLWVVLLLIPMAAMFSALSLALATFARSSKEGQYYLTPLLMVTIGLTFYCLSPAQQLSPFNSIIPLVGPMLLLKELLGPTGGSDALVYAFPVLATSFGYSLLALWWAIEQFSREDILFREAERFDLRLWLRHLLRDKEPTPSFAQAGVCFVLIMLLQLTAIKYLGQAVAGVSDDQKGTMFQQILVVQQLALIASPAILMGVILTSNPRRTFRLYWPKWRYLAMAVGLPLVLHPLTIELSALLGQWFFPPLPKEVSSQLGVISDPSQPLWLMLLAFAIAPAICEETAFRGFILSGFDRSRRCWLAIVLSAAAFGLMHMIPQQVFNATLLGLVIGLLAVRSNSLLPPIVFHFVNNALAVANRRIGGATSEWSDPFQMFVTVSGEQLRFELPLLAICAVLAGGVIRKLILEDRRPELDDAGFIEPGRAGETA